VQWTLPTCTENPPASLSVSRIRPEMYKNTRLWALCLNVFIFSMLCATVSCCELPVCMLCAALSCLCAAVCCCLLLCAVVITVVVLQSSLSLCCSHHCLHSYPCLLSPQTPFQVHVHTSESQLMCSCVYLYYQTCVSQALGKAAGCIRCRHWKEHESERAARCVMYTCLYM